MTESAERLMAQTKRRADAETRRADALETTLDTLHDKVQFTMLDALRGMEASRGKDETEYARNRGIADALRELLPLFHGDGWPENQEH